MDKSINGCVFCHKTKYYICGNCVQRLLAASDVVIKRAIKLAEENGYKDKAEALIKFTGVANESNRPVSDRRRNRRDIRMQKRTNRVSTKGRKTTVR